MADFASTSRLNLLMQRHWLCTLGLMVLAFVVFGVLSLKLVDETLANWAFIRKYGWLALEEGAFWQLLWLVLQSVGAVLAYLTLKACESALIQRLFMKR